MKVLLNDEQKGEASPYLLHVSHCFHFVLIINSCCPCIYYFLCNINCSDSIQAKFILKAKCLTINNNIQITLFILINPKGKQLKLKLNNKILQSTTDTGLKAKMSTPQGAP